MLRLGVWRAGTLVCLLWGSCADDAASAGAGDAAGDAGHGDVSESGDDVVDITTGGHGDAVQDIEGDAGPGATGADTTIPPDGSDAASPPDSTDTSEEPNGSAPTTPFRSPCGPADACEGPGGACVRTSLGDRCTRPCQVDADCGGWRCVFCGDRCGGALGLHCVPLEDAADVIACEPGVPGYVQVTLSPSGGDRHLDDAPCTVDAADPVALAFTLGCPGAVGEPLTVTLAGNSALAPPALTEGAAVRLTWEQLGDVVGGPVRFVLRDSEGRLILAALKGGMEGPVPGGEVPAWKLAPLEFDLLDTGCPLVEDECKTALPLALLARLGQEQTTLLALEVAELGQGPRWQVHLTGAQRVVTPLDEVLCTDIWPRSLRMVVTRIVE